MKTLHILQKDTKVGSQNLATKFSFVPDWLIWHSDKYVAKQFTIKITSYVVISILVIIG